MPGMFEDHNLADNIAGLRRSLALSHEERAALGAATNAARAMRGRWLQPHYQWLDNRWSGMCG
jgi:hypothetical protein